MTLPDPTTMSLVLADRFAVASAPADEVIELAFEQRERSRFRASLLSGEEIGVDLPRGSLIRHGDRLLLQDGRVVAVEAAPERLMEVRAADAAGLARLAYHIGNRHVPLQVGAGWLRLLPDHVLRAMIEGLGGRVTDVETGFQPESGAYGHSHVHHQHDDQGHGGRIHAFDPRTEGQAGRGHHHPAGDHHHPAGGHHHHPAGDHDHRDH